MQRLLLLVLLAWVAPVEAQEHAHLDPGARVRLLLLPATAMERGGPQRLHGTLVRATADSLTVQIHGEIAPISIPVGWIDRVERYGGEQSVWGAGLDGFTAAGAVGAGLGALIGAEVANTTGAPWFRTVLSRAAAYGFSLGATNALRRMIHPGDVWERVPVRPILAAGEGTPRVGLRIALAW